MIKDINDYYFTDEDYDLFIEEKQTQNGNVIREDRKIAQEKLLDLNSKLLPKLQIEGHMDLHNHKNPDNITSLIFPCVYNKGMVNWIGVRYGKHKDFIALLNEMLPKYPTYNKYGERMPVKDTKRGFQKYACMQVNIGYTGVDVGMYHAVPQACHIPGPQQLSSSPGDRTGSKGTIDRGFHSTNKSQDIYGQSLLLHPVFLHKVQDCTDSPSHRQGRPRILRYHNRWSP